jgi:hypothetical protein
MLHRKIPRVLVALNGSNKFENKAESGRQRTSGAITSVGQVWSPAFRRLGVRIHAPWKGRAPGRLKAGLQT